jgi:hypothetical protein
MSSIMSNYKEEMISSYFINNNVFSFLLFGHLVPLTYPAALYMYALQVVTKRRRLSLLTNSAHVIRVQMRGEGGSCSVSANEYSCVHHVTQSPNKLWRSTSIFNLCMYGNKETK